MGRYAESEVKVVDLEKLDHNASEVVQTMLLSVPKQKERKQNIQRVRDQIHAMGKSFKELRDVLVVLYNSYLSSVESVDTGDRTPFEAKKDLMKDIANFTAAIADFTETKTRTDTSQQSLDLLNLQFMKKSAESKSQLQSALIKNGTFIGYAPIIPLTKPNLVVEDLNKRGIKARMYEGYPLLERQLVAGITMERQGKVTEPGKETPNQKKIPLAKQKAAEKETFEEFIKTVKAKFPNMQLVALGEPNSWWKTTWVWLVPEKELEQMRKCVFGGGNSLQIMKWGFAFHGEGK